MGGHIKIEHRQCKQGKSANGNDEIGLFSSRHDVLPVRLMIPPFRNREFVHALIWIKGRMLMGLNKSGVLALSSCLAGGQRLCMRGC